MPVLRENYLVIYLATVILLLNTFVIGKDCISQNGCSCQFDDGSGTIDLTSLGNTDGTPRFKDVPKDGSQDASFSYNPCAPFDEQECTNAAVCFEQIGGSQNIGDADSAMFKYDDTSDKVYAGYTSQSAAVTKNTQVKLICDPNGCDSPATFTPTDGGSSDVIVQYFAELKTVCACPNMCSPSGPKNCGGAKSGSVSAGTIILIGVLGLFMLYFVLGTVYMKAVKKATGTDMIPNKAVWAGGCGMIGSGFKFLLGKCFPGKFSGHKEVA